MHNSKKRASYYVFALIWLMVANLLIFLTIWLSQKYDNVLIDQFIYQMKTPAAGANRTLRNSAIIKVGLFGVLLTFAETMFYLVCTGRFENKLKKYHIYAKIMATKVCDFVKRKAMPIALSCLLVAVSAFTIRFDVIGYVNKITSDSKLIENHYVSPDDAVITFPKEKRNLIYIFLESMEVTYADTENGGTKIDYIPELTKLAKENISFSNTSGLGGGYSFNGTTWTAASMVSQTSGMIVQVPLTAENYGGENEYIPGLVSLGEILEKQGYNQTLLLGSDASFASRDSYFTEHGNYNVVDINALKEEGRLPQDYVEWWGYEDEKLFKFAKEELEKLSKEGEPFNFTMLTADTHFPDGYVCPQCDDEYESQYANVLRCSSKQVYSFIEWIKEQEFYENTTIVISGDHLTMDPKFLEDLDETYERTLYNCIINSPTKPVKEKNREFATFDMLPTTLAAMGVEIEGDKLGLGVNLFSGEKTMTEEYGFELLNYELQKNSEFYNTKFLEMNKEEAQKTR